MKDDGKNIREWNKGAGEYEYCCRENAVERWFESRQERTGYIRRITGRMAHADSYYVAWEPINDDRLHVRMWMESL